jgi:SAM-dependent methyltransferase
MWQNGFSEEFLKALIEETIMSSPPGPWNITRHYMYTKLSGLLKGSDAHDKKCLSISNSENFARLIGLHDTSLTEANYPEQNILQLGFPPETFDFCVSDQVLEHVEGDPFIAFEESVRVVKKGGFIAHTTCFINQIHNMPRDLWRFTPDALSLIAKHCNTSVIENGGWGNKEVWTYIDLGFRWTKVPLSPSHPINHLAMKNDPSVPIVSWVVAQKL